MFGFGKKAPTARVLNSTDVAAIDTQLAAASATRLQALQQDPARRRSALLRSGLRGLFVGIFIGVFGAFILAAATGWGVIAIAIGLAAGLLGGPIVGARLSGRMLASWAREEADQGFMQARGFQYLPQFPIQGETPFLRLPVVAPSSSLFDVKITTSGGMNNTWIEVGDGYAGMIGRLGFRIGEITIVTEHESTDSDGKTTRSESRKDYGVAIVPGDLGPLGAIELQRGSSDGIFAKLIGKVTDKKAVQLESTQLMEQYSIMLADGAPEQAIRERFTPAVQQALVDRAAGNELVQAERGHVMIAQPRHGDWNAAHMLALIAEVIWWRQLLCAQPPGRVPDTAGIHAAVLGQPVASTSPTPTPSSLSRSAS